LGELDLFIAGLFRAFTDDSIKALTLKEGNLSPEGKTNLARIYSYLAVVPQQDPRPYDRWARAFSLIPHY
jgi:hypothetical protein